MVLFRVGSSQTKYFIHRKLACEKIPWLTTALESFSEQDGIVNLPEASPNIFELLIDWVYRGRIPHGNTHEYYVNLHKLYVLADLNCNFDLANDTIDKIDTTAKEQKLYHGVDVVTNIHLVSYIYENTADGSPIRRYVIQAMAYSMWDKEASLIPDSKAIETLMKFGGHHPDLARDYWDYLRRTELEGEAELVHPWLSKQRCDFHRHKGGLCPPRPKIPEKWVSPGANTQDMTIDSEF